MWAPQRRALQEMAVLPIRSAPSKLSEAASRSRETPAFHGAGTRPPRTIAPTPERLFVIAALSFLLRHCENPSRGNTRRKPAEGAQNSRFLTGAAAIAEGNHAWHAATAQRKGGSNTRTID